MATWNLTGASFDKGKHNIYYETYVYCWYMAKRGILVCEKQTKTRQAEVKPDIIYIKYQRKIY